MPPQPPSQPAASAPPQLLADFHQSLAHLAAIQNDLARRVRDLESQQSQSRASLAAAINRAARADQLKCINAYVQASAHPYIVTGDLNAPPDSPEIAAFLGSNVLLFAGDPKAPTHRVMEQRLDYILADPGWVVRSARVLDDGPSDHRPVIAELTHP